MATGAVPTDQLRDDLRRLFARARMPSSPALAARILQLIDDPAADVRDFAEVLRTDAALVARLLKTANSAEFVQRNAVTTIERAVSVVGLNRVKAVSLGFQLVAHLDRLGGAPFDMRAFWQHALLRACLARTLTRQITPSRQEEAFLIGLLLDCGIALVVQLQGVRYAKLYQSTPAPASFHASETASFPYTHVDAIAALAAEWKLPALIAEPLRTHHLPPPQSVGAEDNDAQLLRRVAYFVGNLRFAGDGHATAAERDLLRFLHEDLRVTEDAFNAVQRAATGEYRSLAPLYGDFVDEGADVTELLGEANRHLASLAAATDERLVNVEEQRASTLREQERLRAALCEYRERAAMDPLTSLLNRGALTDSARRLIEENRDRGTSLGCLFLDVDDFKKLNDAAGHRIGDNVLRAIAALLQRECSGWGEAGRYGGEEFVILFRSPTPADTRIRGEGIVERVAAIDAASLDCPTRISCSLGAAWFGPATVTSAEEFFARADQLMYQAKREGKNRACFAAIAGVSSTTPADDTALGCHSSDQSTPPGSLVERLASLACRLNAGAAGDRFEGIRKQQRRAVVCPCVAHYFLSSGVSMRSEPGVTRNMTTGGMAVLVSRSMVRGEALEVELDRGSAKLYLAGLVTYCRHVEGAIHELGVQFVKHSVTPIIYENVKQAITELDWLPRAIETTRNSAAAASR